MLRPSRFYLFAGYVSRPVVYRLYRYKARGLDHVPRSGGLVLASNHASNFDPWPLGAAFFPDRYLRFMTKSELFWWPLKVLLDWGGAFPVRRGEADVQAIRTAVDLCRDGHIVVMFPEGTQAPEGAAQASRGEGAAGRSDDRPARRGSARAGCGARNRAVGALAPLVGDLRRADPARRPRRGSSCARPPGSPRSA